MAATKTDPTVEGSAIESIVKDVPKTKDADIIKAAEGTAWADPGSAAYNFFSDTATSGTPAMLHAIRTSSLLDDVFSEDPTTLSLERFVSELFGFESSLLVLSGTMGNQLALRVHMLSPPASVVADARSHIITAEANGLAAFSQAMPYTIEPANGSYVTLEEVKRKVVLSDDQHVCPTKVVSLENTIGGAVIPLEECQRISEWARSNGVKMHLDGARIWEAVSAQVARGEHGGDFVTGIRAYAKCFDSIQTCFSKGLGAPIGSIVMGDAGFIKKARHFRKAIGGGIRAAGIIAGPARVAIDETFLGGKLAATHVLARRVAEMWEQRGGRISQPVETNMVWLDMQGSGVEPKDFVSAGKEAGLKLGTSRVVCHYQLSEDALTRLAGVMDLVLGPSRNGANDAQ